MRVLLDTNVLVHREASTVVRRDIGNVFFWLDKLRHDKLVHPVSISEIAKHQDQKVRNSFQAKLQSYNILKTIAPMSATAQQFAATDKSENDRNDTSDAQLCSEQSPKRTGPDRAPNRGVDRRPNRGMPSSSSPLSA